MMMAIAPVPDETSDPSKFLAGPLLRSGEVTDALIDALREDNAGKELVIADHGGYIRVEGAGGLVLNRATAEYMLGRPFVMQELELYMTGFSGKIYTTTESVRWFFKQSN
jgi:toluene monooxygenase system protein D